MSSQALRFFEKLREQPEYNTPEVWRRLAACQQALGNDDGAADIYCNILEGEPATLACEPEYSTRQPCILQGSF